MNCKLDRGELGLDQALLNITTNVTFPIQIFSQAVDCDECSLLYQATVASNSSVPLKVDTTFATILQVVTANNTDDILCQQQYYFGEHGKYILNILQDNIQDNTCNIVVRTPAINSNLYIFWAFLFFFLIGIVWTSGIIIYRRKFKNAEEDERLLVSDLGLPSERGSGSQIWSFSVEPNSARLKDRLRSLDTFRGICIVIMIFVNYGGGKYWFFKHSSWNGLTVADLVFPWFMWIMGLSITLSIQSQLRKVVSKKKIFWKILRRAVVLFSLELMLNSKYGLGCELSHMRILGVLQRFAVTYLIVATLQLLSEKPGDVYQFERWASFRDIFSYWAQWIFISLIVAAHLLITFLLPIPGCPTGYLGPGGLHLNSSYVNCTGGAAGYIDRLVLGENHMYQTPSCKNLYETIVPFDPEGILGYLSATLTVFLGLQAGKIVTMYPLHSARIRRWILWALITGTIGAVLCEVSLNDGWIPINKNLWSVSYVLVTSSMAFLLLTICYVLVDVLSWWSGSPFLYPGMNAILLYVGHEITAKWFPWYIPVSNTHAAQLCMDIWGTFLWVIISVWLYYYQVFLAI